MAAGTGGAAAGAGAAAAAAAGGRAVVAAEAAGVVAVANAVAAEGAFAAEAFACGSLLSEGTPELGSQHPSPNEIALHLRAANLAQNYHIT